MSLSTKNNHMKTVKIYSTPSCGYCRMEKEWLSEKGVEYTDVDIAADQEEAAKMVEKTGQMGVPVTVISEAGKDDVVITGFDQGQLMEHLSIEA